MRIICTLDKFARDCNRPTTVRESPLGKEERIEDNMDTQYPLPVQGKSYLPSIR